MKNLIGPANCLRGFLDKKNSMRNRTYISKASLKYNVSNCGTMQQIFFLIKKSSNCNISTALWVIEKRIRSLAGLTRRNFLFYNYCQNVFYKIVCTIRRTENLMAKQEKYIYIFSI